MADAGADLCIAFSDQPVTRGTADMVRRAKAAGIPVWVIGHG
jgi:DNA-binding MurR/RpiR family transcriptional regulator